MPSFAIEEGGSLVIERIAPRKTEEELREERARKFVDLLGQVPDLAERPEVFDTQGVRAALGKPDDALDREAAQTFGEGFRRLLAQEAAKG